jgi:hypothetical protein
MNVMNKNLTSGTRGIPGFKYQPGDLQLESKGKVGLGLSYGCQSVDQFILVSGSPLGPRFYPYPFFSDNCFVVLPVGRPL